MYEFGSSSTAQGRSPVSGAASEMPPDFTAAFDAIHAGIDALLDLADRDEWSRLSRPDLAASIAGLERVRNRLSAVDHRVVEAANRTELWEMTRARDAAGAISEIARIPRGEAKARVRAAAMLAPDSALTGQRLPARLPKAASAQRDGSVSASQAKVIEDCVRELQGAVGDGEASRDAEAALLQYCAAFDAVGLRKIAHRIVDVVVPDGRPPRDELVKARRGITLGTERSDGSCSISGSLTKSLRAKLHSVLSPLAAPRTAENGIHDTRSDAQRMHDALEDACDRLLRTGDLPGSAGSPATVMIVAQLDDLLTQMQQREAGFGAPAARSTAAASFTTVDGRVISLDEFLHLAATAAIIPVFMSKTDGIVAYGRTRRFASPGQWKALIARDVGCSFPGCDIPPQWCEAHHVIPWAAGGETQLNNLTLVCGYHHREFENRGWACRIIDGMPRWVPPHWVDPDRETLQNQAHLSHPITDEQALAALNSAYESAERERWVHEQAAAAWDRLGPPTTERISRLLDRDLDRVIASWTEEALDRRLTRREVVVGRDGLGEG